MSTASNNQNAGSRQAAGGTVGIGNANQNNRNQSGLDTTVEIVSRTIGTEINQHEKVTSRHLVEKRLDWATLCFRRWSSLTIRHTLR